MKMMTSIVKRERFRQVRLETSETQVDLAERLHKSRVSISDMERGRVAVSAADLAIISNHYGKPISFFYPPSVSVNKDNLSQIEEELIFLFNRLPITQQRISLQYTKQQVEITNKADEHELNEIYTEFQSNKKDSSIPPIPSINSDS